MKGTVYVMGHKNPDSDSICSAIAYADLKRKLGFQTIPVRLGEMNKETKFILNYFEVSEPEYLGDVKTQVQDLDMDVIRCVSEGISIKSAWEIMTRNNFKVLPIVDDNEVFVGMVTLSDITRRYIDALSDNSAAMNKIPIKNLIETINARLISTNSASQVFSGKIVIAAMTPEEMSPYVEEGDILIVGNRMDNQLQAIRLGADCLVVTCNGKIEEPVIKAAAETNCIVMVTPYDTYTTARLMSQSIPVSFIMTTDNIIRFLANDYIDDVREKMLKSRFRSYPVIDSDGKLTGFISRYHLMTQHKKKVILVDHNEIAQTVDGIEQAEIIEIIDHHRIGGSICTSSPIVFKNEPVGSTSTIIANLYFEQGIRPSGRIAGILCAAIISDTLKFKSPTCSYIDISIAQRLAQIAGIEIDAFSLAMFKEATTLVGKSAEEVLFQDFKQFNMGKFLVGIGQINTSDNQGLSLLQTQLIDCMEKCCAERHFDLMLLMLTDILNEGSEILFVGKERALISRAFKVQISGNSVYLPGVLSRKKQVAPSISDAIDCSNM